MPLWRKKPVPTTRGPGAGRAGAVTAALLPGTPAIQNAIPMPFFGTTPFAAPGLGVIASAIMLAFGLWWLNRATARARLAGEPLEFDGPAAPVPQQAHFGGGAKLEARDLEQVHIAFALEGLPQKHADYFSLQVFAIILGGGMSSRLFQEVREKRGLVYSVYSFSQQFADAGVAGVYAGCQPKRLDMVRQVCADVLSDVAQHGITQAELDRAKGQVSGGTVLGLEDTSSRMSRIARAEMTMGWVPSVSQVLDEVAAVSLSEVRSLAHQVWSADVNTVVVGP